MTDSAAAPVPDQVAPSWWPFPSRFMVFLLALPVACAALAPLLARWGQVVLSGFDVAALLFIVSLWPLTRDHSVAEMREKTRRNDTGRVAVLVLTSLVIIVIVTAVTVELPGARNEKGMVHTMALALVLISLVIAWLFSNLVFALHYAHLYYRADGRGDGGLNFPKSDQGAGAADDVSGSGPDYFDFAYYSLTIGMAFATSDIALSARNFRRVTLIHAIIAFFYNLVVLAFTINVTASS